MTALISRADWRALAGTGPRGIFRRTLPSERPLGPRIKIGIVLVVVVVGFTRINTDNLVPFAPFGLGGAFTGAATVFFAVFGYDALTTAAEESLEAQRKLPKARISHSESQWCSTFWCASF